MQQARRLRLSPDEQRGGDEDFAAPRARRCDGRDDAVLEAPLAPETPSRAERPRRGRGDDDASYGGGDALPQAHPAVFAAPRVLRAPRRLRGVHVAEIPGLRVILDAVSVAEERAALAEIARDRGVPASNIHRATQWGWRFSTWGRVPPMSLADRLAPVPRWLRAVGAALEAADAPRALLPPTDQWGAGVAHALLNEYEPGDGVTAHTDDVAFWTSWVLGLSLGADVTMRFHPPPPEDDDAPPAGPIDVRLPARSVYVLTGDARWRWSHEIERATHDEVDGVLVPRGRRTSVTLRGISHRWLPHALAVAAEDA